MTARADLPKIASNNRLTPTPEEAQPIAIGTFALFGMYTLDEAKKTFTVRCEASTFPNLIGTDGTDTIVSITADELTSIFVPVSGGQLLQTWRRAK